MAAQPSRATTAATAALLCLLTNVVTLCQEEEGEKRERGGEGGKREKGREGGRKLRKLHMHFSLSGH